jgi:DNA-binding NarL/FixJ family response regulator
LTRLLVVDDQELVRRGLVTLLNMEDDLEVVAEAADGREAVEKCSEFQPDVVLMDVQMPVMNGVEATTEILERTPQVKVLVLSTFAEDEYIVKLVRAGASGYLLKNMQPDLLSDAIRAVHKGVTQLDASVAQRLARYVATTSSPIGSLQVDLNKLSGREVEVLKLLAEGKSNKEISAALSIADGTVRNYVSNILLVLGVTDRTQAAIWALKNLNSSDRENEQRKGRNPG